MLKLNASVYTVTYLDIILFSHREAAKQDTRSFDKIVEKTSDIEPTRPFRKALEQTNSLAVISEIKKASPSKGIFPRPEALNTVEKWAKSYADGDATCLSVLTDEQFFQGSPEDLQEAKKSVPLPVLRKDFTVSVNNIVDARIMGADAILLIVAALDMAELKDFSAVAKELNMDVLIETHDEQEVEKALSVDAQLLGINQRDLETFEVDTERAIRVGKIIPDGITKVAESGIKSPEQATHLRNNGFDAVLVGESLVTSSDPTAAVQALRKA